MTIQWADGRPQKRKGDKGRASIGASFASNGEKKLTVYRVKKDKHGELWHAAVNGKRIEAGFNSIVEAKAAAEKAAT